MRIGRLICREILFRKLSFLLGLLSVAAAVACLVGVIALLDNYDRQTERIATAEQHRVAEATDKFEAASQQARLAMAKLQEDFRKLTLTMGFTTVVVADQQDLGELFSKGYATHYMPEDYGDQLAEKKVMTLNHLLPVLEERTSWPEQHDAAVQLIGVKGEVWIQSKMQTPLQATVPAGAMVVGQQLQKALNLKKDQKVTFHGGEFTITGIRPGQGGPDDIGVWIDLATAQKMLNHPGQINAILGVECMCPGDRVTVIKQEILQTLKDVQVYEFSNIASARAAARRRVDEAARAQTEHERQNVVDAKASLDQHIKSRLEMREQKASFAQYLIPTVIIVCAIWIAFLAFNNVRDRRTEIGILRAIGVRSGRILTLFLGKAMVIGLAGAAVGFVAGVLLSAQQSHIAPGHVIHDSGAMLVKLLVVVLLAAPVLVLLASMIPALVAARQDPADILRND